MKVSHVTVTVHLLFVLQHFRLLLAALHFNENANRQQAETQQGEARYNLVFPKARQGGCVTRRVLQDPTYSKCTSCNNISTVLAPIDTGNWCRNAQVSI